jgi:hypothetical protein
MFKNISNDLIVMNKLILFSNNILDEDIDINMFKNYLYETNDFICNTLNILWSDFLKNDELIEKENFIKSYYFVIKRFQKFLFRFNDLINKNKNYALFENEEINNIINFNQEKINVIRDNKYNISSISSINQYINEEEYSKLLEKEDNEFSS